MDGVMEGSTNDQQWKNTQERGRRPLGGGAIVPQAATIRFQEDFLQWALAFTGPTVGEGTGC
jgi:hypothetical protein